MEQDTIAAIATPSGQGGIGVIRFSGPDGLSILGRVWEGKTSPKDFRPRRIYFGRAVFDQVIAFYMQGPNSYTGEDVLEIQAHGSQRGLEILLEAILKAGARQAEPGEFTKRAFLNGRIDLTQAEAVADLIAATNERAVTLAGRQMEGRLKDYVEKLRNDLKVMRAQMEAMIDFPEDEDVQGLRDEETVERLDRIEAQLQSLLQTYEEGRYIKEGIRVAIVGKPNAGKSSLFNALLKNDRAIVHASPGTTRDTIEEVLNLKGLTVRFIDTAGIRTGEESVEAEGIRRSQQKIEQADLILFVLDSSRPWEPEDDRVKELIADRRHLCLFNKSDLRPAFDPSIPVLRISAKKEEGIDDLKSAISNLFITKASDSEIILTNLRHRTVLAKGLEVLQTVKQAALEKRSLELLVSDLSLAMSALGEVTGEVTNDEILGEIFSKFCIGK